MTNIEVTGLSYYPIKSCSGTDVDMISVGPNGFECDREWMLVDENGTFISQRKNPELALVYPSIDASHLRIYVAGQEPLEVSTILDFDKDLVHATVHDKPVVGQYEGPEAADWFSNFLNKEVRLLRVSPELPRYVTDRYHRADTANQVGFADGFPLTIASTASLRAFNNLLAEAKDINRFRPNIVVSGDELEPYDEDYWRKVQIGEVTAYVVRACARCEITDTNQVTAQRGREVRSALSHNRRGIDTTSPKQKKDMFFMQNLLHRYRPGMILRVGDEVTIEERASQPNFIAIN